MERNLSTNQWLAKISQSGYRLTAPLRAVVSVVCQSERALGPVEIFDLSRSQYPGLGLVTVYRTLEKLEDLGLVQRVHQPGGCNMYIRANQGHEHLLLCRSCGQAQFFSGDDLTSLISSIASRSGYQIEEHWLQLFGLCDRCKKQGNSPSPDQGL